MLEVSTCSTYASRQGGLPPPPLWTGVPCTVQVVMVDSLLAVTSSPGGHSPMSITSSQFTGGHEWTNYLLSQVVLVDTLRGPESCKWWKFANIFEFQNPVKAG